MTKRWTARLGGDKVLGIILLLSLFLNGYDLWKDKYANTYYTMAVGSMLQSFHNFFYGSLDSAGSVTVDKPPVVFWIQTVSAWIFGLHGWSVDLPQALAGVGSVLLIYLIVKPTFGLAAARIAALVLACTPVAVAVSRTNNIDSMLVFTLLLGTWFLFRGIRLNKFWSVFTAFGMIGIAFNEKMLQAFMVLPAFYLFYVIAARVNWKKKIATLAASTAILAVLTLSWAVVVDSIPKDQRPYIGSSETNSVLELAFGYNGVSRLTGNQGGGRGGAPGNMGDMGAMAGMPGMQGQADNSAAGSKAGDGTGTANAATDGNTNGTAAQNQAGGTAPNGAAGGVVAPANGSTGTNAAADGTGRADGRRAELANGQGQGQMPNFGNSGGGFPGGSNNNGGMFHTGTKGPFRLFQSELSGQASWMIPFAAVACLAVFSSLRRRSFTQKHKEAIFWLAWLVPVMGFFSIAGFFHQYYLIMMGAPAAALVGLGWTELWTAYKEGRGWTSWLLPAAILATTALQWYILHPYDSEIGAGWSYGVGAAGVLMTMVLAFMRGRTWDKARMGAIIGLLVLLVGPMYWAITPIAYGQNSMMPAAGPTASEQGFGGGGMNGGGFPGMPGADGTANSGKADNRAGTGVGSAGSTDGTRTDGTRTDRSRNNFGGPGEGSLNEGLYNYLKEHNGSTTYLFATTNYGTAAPYIIDKNEKVIAMGGFSGNDPVYTTDKLQALVNEGKLKYILLGGGMGGRGGSSDITAWVEANGTAIPASAYSSAASSNTTTADGFGGRFGGQETLYEMKATTQGGTAQ